MKNIPLLIMATALLAIASTNAQTITGNYLEVRSCDIYTGSCFANAEMGLAGKEGMMVWSIRQGKWDDVRLDGLTVIAVVATDATLSDLRYEPQSGKAVIIVDAAANREQQAALKSFACAMAGRLIQEVAEVKSTAIESNLGLCKEAGCANIRAGDFINIKTRCIGSQDHLCGNERTFYPPLTDVRGAHPVVTELASYRGSGLNRTWQLTDYRSAFLAKFAY